MNQPIILAFANQKGGTGKSTIGTHVASILYYNYGYKVAMADFDYPQNSLAAYRKKDLNLLETDAKTVARFRKQAIKPYPIIQSSVESSNADLVTLMEGGYDFILADTPGTLNLKGLPDLIRSIDYMFLPMEADAGTVSSTMGYMKTLSQFLQAQDSSSNLVSFHSFWNKYLKSERKLPYEKIEELFKNNDFNILKSRVESLLTYRDNRSTIFSLPERELEKLGLGGLVMEILSLVVGEGKTTPSGAKIAFQPAANDEPEIVSGLAVETNTANKE
jgi:cellulose biosynthesis protein BcsQ